MNEFIDIPRIDGTFIKKKKIDLKNIQKYDISRIQKIESYMAYIIENEYVNNFEMLEKLFKSDFNLEKIDTDYKYSVACIEQSKKLKQKMDELGLKSYFVTCKPDRFLSKYGDSLIIESHTILVHPCIYNNKLSFVIFDAGFRIKNSILFTLGKGSKNINFNGGIYKIQPISNEDYTYEIYTNRRIDIKSNVYKRDIHWEFNPCYETLNIDDLYYYLFKIMYSYKIILYSSIFKYNPYIVYRVFENRFEYCDGREFYSISLEEIRKMKDDEIICVFSDTISIIGYDISKFLYIIKNIINNEDIIKHKIIDKNVAKEKSL